LYSLAFEINRDFSKIINDRIIPLFETGGDRWGFMPKNV